MWSRPVSTSRSNSHPFVKIFYVIACIIRKKKKSETIVFEENDDIIGISESSLDTKKRDSLAEYVMSGYIV